MRVLELTWEYAPATTGGLGVACAAICDALASHPSLRLVVAQPAPGGARRRRPGLVPEPIVAEGAYAAPWEAVQAYAEAVEHEFAHEPFDVVHAHDWLAFEAALRLRASSGVPMVAHVHSLAIDRDEVPDRRIQALERRCLERAAAVIAVSRATRARILATCAVDPGRVHVVHHGIDLAAADAEGDAARAIPLHERPLRIAFVGRLMAQKAPERFLEVGAALARTRPGLSLSVVGAGPLRAQLQAAADRAGLADRVRFHGFLSAAEVMSVLRASRLLVMPSRQEPFGLAALEAIAAGTPVVINREAGVAEVVPGVCAVDATDPQALAQACAALLDDLPAAEFRRREAWAQARSRDWPSAANDIVRVLALACTVAAEPHP